MPACPACGSGHVVKNGFIHTGKQNHRCRDCGRQFVQDPVHPPITDTTKALIDRLLLERLSLAGVCRATGVSASWLQQYVNHKYAHTPRRAEASDAASEGPPAKKARAGRPR